MKLNKVYQFVRMLIFGTKFVFAYLENGPVTYVAPSIFFSLVVLAKDSNFRIMINCITYKMKFFLYRGGVA